MITFNLEKALAGEAVVLRNGEKAFIKYKVPEESSNSFKYHGYRITELNYYLLCDWNINGKSGHVTDKEFDIVGMWEEQRPQVTITIPAPLKEAPELERNYYTLSSTGVVMKEVWTAHLSDKERLQNGLVFLTREDAESFAEALQEARR